MPTKLGGDELTRLQITQVYLRDALAQVIKGDYTLPEFTLNEHPDDTYTSTKLDGAPKILKKGRKIIKKLLHI